MNNKDLVDLFCVSMVNNNSRSVKNYAKQIFRSTVIGFSESQLIKIKKITRILKINDPDRYQMMGVHTVPKISWRNKII